MYLVYNSIGHSEAPALDAAAAHISAPLGRNDARFQTCSSPDVRQSSVTRLCLFEAAGPYASHLQLINLISVTIQVFQILKVLIVMQHIYHH